MQEILPKEANPHTAEHKKQKFTYPNKVGLIENCRPIQTIELGSNESAAPEIFREIILMHNGINRQLVK